MLECWVEHRTRASKLELISLAAPPVCMFRWFRIVRKCLPPIFAAALMGLLVVVLPGCAETPDGAEPGVRGEGVSEGTPVASRGHPGSIEGSVRMSRVEHSDKASGVGGRFMTFVNPVYEGADPFVTRHTAGNL
jgi:hypothetical protein